MMEEDIKPIVHAPTRKPRLRDGRGFSRKEIRQAGLLLHEVEKTKIPVDRRRKTAHVENVQTLKEYFRTSIPLHEIKGIGKAAEEELKRVGILDTQDLAVADIELLAGKIPHSEKTLKKWQDEAKTLLKNR
jgi:predicted flap endonuclease-1-like 5' DNA nuclease